jgi:lactoylglutathione lyase
MDTNLSTLKLDVPAHVDESAALKFVAMNTLIVNNIQRSVAFYRDVLGAAVLCEGEPTLLRLGNIWLTINGGGGPTDDKPEVVASPPHDPNVLSIFLNLRVTDIKRYYEMWPLRGANFITEPKVHATELRCYLRYPDGYLIEIGQPTMTSGRWTCTHSSCELRAPARNHAIEGTRRKYCVQRRLACSAPERMERDLHNAATLDADRW